MVKCTKSFVVHKRQPLEICAIFRFEVKKWNAVALWAWDIVVDNCAICRNHIMDLCIECQAQHDQEQQAFAGYNRRGSKDSQLR